MANKVHRFVRTPKAVAAMAALLIMLCALMIPPVIGVADNGDFYRAANGMGIYKLDRFQEDQFLNYASTKFGVYEYFNEYEDSLISSQRIFIRFALILDSIFTGEDQIFDIRFLGILYIIYACISIYLLLDFITYKKSVKEGWVLSAIGVFIFADTGYTAYFNSFFTEGLVYVSFLAAISCALLITQKRYPFKIMFVFFVVNSAVLIAAKQQNATAALALFLICLIIAGFVSGSRKSDKVLALFGGGVLIGCGIFVYTVIPPGYRNINQYHAMTRGVMMEAENPESALEFFDIDPQYSILNETNYFEPYPTVDADDVILDDGFYDKYDFVSICIYYITHPDTLFRMLTDAAQEAYIIRPDMLGNYDRSEGKLPGAKTDFFTAYSTFKRNAVPPTVEFALFWILIVAVLNIKDREKLLILLCVILVGLLQVGTSVVGAGDTDLSKHVFLYNAAFDMATYISMSSIVISVSHMIAGIVGGALKGKNRCEKEKRTKKKAV